MVCTGDTAHYLNRYCAPLAIMHCGQDTMLMTSAGKSNINCYSYLTANVHFNRVPIKAEVRKQHVIKFCSKSYVPITDTMVLHNFHAQLNSTDELRSVHSNLSSSSNWNKMRDGIKSKMCTMKTIILIKQHHPPTISLSPSASWFLSLI